MQHVSHFEFESQVSYSRRLQPNNVHAQAMLHKLILFSGENFPKWNQFFFKDTRVTSPFFFTRQPSVAVWTSKVSSALSNPILPYRNAMPLQHLSYYVPSPQRCWGMSFVVPNRTIFLKICNGSLGNTTAWTIPQSWSTHDKIIRNCKTTSGNPAQNCNWRKSKAST